MEDDLLKSSLNFHVYWDTLLFDVKPTNTHISCYSTDVEVGDSFLPNQFVQDSFRQLLVVVEGRVGVQLRVDSFEHRFRVWMNLVIQGVPRNITVGKWFRMSSFLIC